jgi:hypothetical protein
MVPVLIVVVLFAALIWSTNAAARSEDQRQADWVKFSATHHCKVIGRPSFWDSATVWQCADGFQVVRLP